MESVVVWMILFPVVFYLIFITHPDLLFERLSSMLRVVVEWRRKWRGYLVRKYGERYYWELSKEYRQLLSADGFESDVIEEVLAEHQEEIVERLGQKYVSENFPK